MWDRVAERAQEANGMEPRQGRHSLRRSARPQQSPVFSPRFAPRFALGPVLLAILVLVCCLPLTVQAESASPPPAVSEAPPAAPDHSLAALFAVPSVPPARMQEEDPDVLIGAAVARGTNPELERKSNFRKKNFDLFRTEREVEIGDQEMVVRFRLRAKSRETVSVELRF